MYAGSAVPIGDVYIADRPDAQVCWMIEGSLERRTVPVARSIPNSPSVVYFST